MNEGDSSWLSQARCMLSKGVFMDLLLIKALSCHQ